MKKKVLALILAASLVFSTMPVFAEYGKPEKELEVNSWNVGTAVNPLTVSTGGDGKIDYVALGDSISFGYGLPAMGDSTDNNGISKHHSDDQTHNKAFEAIEGSYPVLINHYLENEFGEDKMTFFQGSVSGTRALDYCIFLDQDTYQKDAYHTDYYQGSYFYTNPEDKSYDKFLETLPNEVENADFITLTVGGNDTLLYTLLAMFAGSETAVNQNNLSEFYGKSVVDKYYSLKNSLKGKAGEKGTNLEQIFNMLEVLLYGMGSIVHCEPELLDMIHEMNPDAVIALTGLPGIFNEYDVVDDTSGEVLIDLEQVFSPMSNVLNAHIKNIAEERSSYVRYVDIFDFDHLAVQNEYVQNGNIPAGQFTRFIWSNFLLLTHPSEQGQKQIADKIMANFNFSTGTGKIATFKNYVKNVYTMFMSKTGISKIENFITAIKKVNLSELLKNNLVLMDKLVKMFTKRSQE